MTHQTSKIRKHDTLKLIGVTFELLLGCNSISGNLAIAGYVTRLGCFLFCISLGFISRL